QDQQTVRIVTRQIRVDQNLRDVIGDVPSVLSQEFIEKSSNLS
ncbi:uncharacterized protein METZ01_LOCUS225198, partial [marine metagenome]